MIHDSVALYMYIFKHLNRVGYIYLDHKIIISLIGC